MFSSSSSTYEMNITVVGKKKFYLSSSSKLHKIFQDYKSLYDYCVESRFWDSNDFTIRCPLEREETGEEFYYDFIDDESWYYIINMYTAAKSKIIVIYLFSPEEVKDTEVVKQPVSSTNNDSYELLDEDYSTSVSSSITIGSSFGIKRRVKFSKCLR